MDRALEVVDNFTKHAKALRAHFDDVFSDPRGSRRDRFVWDFWHVPGQYTTLRTPAWEFFPENIYNDFHTSLVNWGRENLGCHDISPPWMSCYVEGCRQELHGDLPHGPWAFVFSLTPWETRTFRGGQTILLQEHVLDYWRDFISETSIEERHLIREVEPKFNRLTVFDPRIPHGVRRVEGTLDPREARLVIHGWFVQPRPFVTGPLSRKAVEATINDVNQIIEQYLQSGLLLAGVLSFSVKVNPDGSAKRIKVLTDSTRTPAEQEALRQKFQRELVQLLKTRNYPKAKAESTITLPLVFERGEQ